MGHHRGDRASGLNQKDPRHATYCNRLVDPVLVSTSRNIFQSQKYFRGTFSVPKIFSRNILRRTPLLYLFGPTPRQRVPRGVLFPIRFVKSENVVKSHAVKSREGAPVAPFTQFIQLRVLSESKKPPRTKISQSCGLPSSGPGRGAFQFRVGPPMCSENAQFT